MKRILIVSSCGKRRDTIGLIGNLLSALSSLDRTKYNISLLDTNFFERNHFPRDYSVDNYYTLNKNIFDNLIQKIPYYRSYYAKYKAIKAYKDLLSKESFDIVLVYQVPSYSDKLVRIAHHYQAKIVFEPFGSDILRASIKAKKKLLQAFSNVDAVCGREKSGTILAAQEIYHVPCERIKLQPTYLPGISMMKALRGKYTRNEMMAFIGIPYSDYNIVCGYSGRESHRHRLIIKSLIQVKDLLPPNSQIVFPMTYGAGTHHEIILKYAAELRKICVEAGLNSVFLTDFLSDKGMAFLHLVTDLFIEIQPSDNGNAFMTEALFANNKIVTGRWLNYQRYEQFGEPYYLIDSPSDLSAMLFRIFTHQVDEVGIPQKLIENLDASDDKGPGVFWDSLFESMC